MIAHLIELVAGNLLLALAIAALACLATRRRVAPRWVHALWLLALVKLVTPAAFEFRLLPPVRVAADPSAALEEPANDQDTTSARTAGQGVRWEPPVAPTFVAPTHAPTAPTALGETPAVRSFDDPLAYEPMTTPRAEYRGNAARRPAPGAAGGTSAMTSVSTQGATKQDATQRGGMPGRSIPWPAWPTWLAAAWALGALVVWARARAQLTALARALRLSDTVRSPRRRHLQAEVDKLAGRIGLARAPQVCIVPLRWSPSVCRLAGRTRLVVSAELLERLDADERRTLLMHELAHLRRRDPLVRYLELFVRGVYWWNPLLPWFCRRLRAAEEECCDAWVLATLPDSGRAYASALVSTAEFLSSAPPHLPATASGLGRVENLQRRLNMILQPRSNQRTSLFLRLGVGALAAAALPILPSFSQSQVSETTPDTQARALLEALEEPAVQDPAAEWAEVADLEAAQYLESLAASANNQAAAVAQYQQSRALLSDALARSDAQHNDTVALVEALVAQQSNLKPGHSNYQKLEQQISDLRAQLAALNSEKQALADELDVRRNDQQRAQDAYVAAQEEYAAWISAVGQGNGGGGAVGRAGQGQSAYNSIVSQVSGGRGGNVSSGGRGGRGNVSSGGGAGGSRGSNQAGMPYELALDALMRGASALEQLGDKAGRDILITLADEYSAKAASDPRQYVRGRNGTYVQVQQSGDDQEARLQRLEDKVEHLMQLIERQHVQTGGGGAR